MGIRDDGFKRLVKPSIKSLFLSLLSIWSEDPWGCVFACEWETPGHQYQEGGGLHTLHF